MGKQIRLLLAAAVVMSMFALGAVPAGATGTTLYVDKAGCGGLTSCYTTIQAAIDAANSGDTILVLPGVYDEAAAGRSLYNGSGPYQFGLFIGITKDGITIQGVDAAGNPVTDAANTAAVVTTNATNGFGYSGVFVEADDVTIAGLEIRGNTPANVKTIEVIGDGFTLRDCKVDVQGAAVLVYVNDPQYDTAGTSHVTSYRIEGNALLHATGVIIASGTGVSGLVTDRVITGNTFAAEPEDGGLMILSGTSATSGGWYHYPVGGAVIADNVFSGGSQYIVARGEYDNSQLDWASYWNDNTFDKAAVVGPTAPATVREYSCVSSTTFAHCRRIGTAVQAEIDHAQDGDTVLVGAGTYNEGLQIALPISLLGANAGIAYGGARGAESDLHGYLKVLSTADGTVIDGLKFTDGAQVLAGEKAAIHVVGGVDGLTVRNSLFVRSGAFDAYGGIINEIGGGADFLIEDNSFTGWATGIYLQNVAGALVQRNRLCGNNVGISSDGGADVLVVGNTLCSNAFEGMGVGAGTIGPAVTLRDNSFSGNAFGLRNYTTAAVQATSNWWGSVRGPTHSGNSGGDGDDVSDHVTYVPWSNQDLSAKYIGGTLAVVAPGATFYAGQTVNVDIVLSGAADLAGFSLDLSFDEDLLEAQAVQVADASHFDWSTGWLDPTNAIDNSDGTIHWAVTQSVGLAQANGTGAIARIVFVVKAPVATPSVAEVAIDGYLLSDIDADSLIPTDTEDDTVAIGVLSGVSGRVRLQGRESAGAGYSGAVVTFDSMAPFTTVADGLYSFAVVPGTSGRVSVERASYLDAWRTGVTSPVNLGDVTLAFGDMNDDETVNIQDMAFMAYRYGTHPGDTRWDARADMNANGIVNIYDLTAAAANYSKSSAAF
ncbi:MAG: cohesin domain-containing protein [Anaerolineae bacterium]